MNPNFDEDDCRCSSPMIACAITGAIIAALVSFAIWYLPLTARINYLEAEVERLEMELDYATDTDSH